MKALKLILEILWILFLTILTQVGGIIYLFWKLLYARKIKLFIHEPWKRQLVSSVGFSACYMIFNLFIIPLVAAAFNRVPLPYSKQGNLVPVSYWTCILNRNYINREGKTHLLNLSQDFVAQHPNCQVKYMDCNFPFRFVTSKHGNSSGIPIIEGLFPHFSHVGNKADIAFIYNNETGEIVQDTPTAIGYGSSVDPLPRETCTPCTCDEKNGLYSFMYRNLPRDKSLELNNEHSSALVKLFLQSKHIIYTLLERHLRERFKLNRYRFGRHSCTSVRHDDHFHVELR
jgi:hypothetical protein